MPDQLDDLLDVSATELARRIRTGATRSRDVVAAHVARIEAVNPRINAVVADRFDDAMREANAADAKLDATPAHARDQLPAFHGVPCTIKEAFFLKDMPNTAGLVSRKGQRSERDGVTVARLRAAGAIPLGVTNVSELCMWNESDNRVYGRSNNPHDPRRIVGGSSGGEAAIIAARGSPFGLGSDIGGSIRMPAFFCGVYGHKPSAGLIPGSGQFPAPDGDAMRLLTSGPLARRAEDLHPLLKILAGPDGDDPTCRPMPLGDPSEVRLDELTLLVPTRDSFARIDPAMLDTLETVASALQALGLRRESITLPKPSWTFRRWSALMAVGSSERFGAMLRPSRPVGAAELLPWALRRSPHTLPAIVLAALANTPHPRPTTLSKIKDEVGALRSQLDDRLARGVLLYPPYSRPAPRHGGPKLTPFDFTHTALFNVLGLPVTQTPTGIDHLRRPLGVQVVSAHGNDHVTLAVGQALERVFGGSVLS